jgi:hypothetical protein
MSRAAGLASHPRGELRRQQVRLVRPCRYEVGAAARRVDQPLRQHHLHRHGLHEPAKDIGSPLCAVQRRRACEWHSSAAECSRLLLDVVWRGCSTRRLAVLRRKLHLRSVLLRWRQRSELRRLPALYASLEGPADQSDAKASQIDGRKGEPDAFSTVDRTDGEREVVHHLDRSHWRDSRHAHQLRMYRRWVPPRRSEPIVTEVEDLLCKTVQVESVDIDLPRGGVVVDVERRPQSASGSRATHVVAG